jgi:Glycosyltransferase family 17
MKIYDCFTFYNEHDLLAIRLKELYDCIDYFVIVEANQTFTNRDKPWNFDLTQHSQYADKIRYIQVQDMPGGTNPWINEYHQRNAIMRGLFDADDNDIVIVSDCDELLRARALNQLRSSEQTLFALRMPLFNFKFNYMRKTPGQYDAWAMAARRRVLDDITPNTLREMRLNFGSAPFQFVNHGCELIEHAGWHFGYLGNTDFLHDKAKSFSHQEVNTPEFLAQIDIEASIRERKEWNRNNNSEYTIVELDNYFPSSILRNIEQYKQYILEKTECSVLDILPPYIYN